jgi:hypothetical protein
VIKVAVKLSKKSFLTNSYKIVSNIPLSRRIPYREARIAGDNQCEFLYIYCSLQTLTKMLSTTGLTYL